MVRPGTLIEWLLYANGLGSVAILLVWLIRPWLRRRFGAGVVFAIWTLVMVRMMIPVFPHFPWLTLPAEVPTYRATIRIEESAPERSREPEVAEFADARVTSPHRMDWSGVFLGVWGIGILAVFGLPVFGAIRGRRLIERATDRTREVAVKVPGLPSRVRVLVTGEVAGPALCGWLNPVILLPADGIETWSAGQLRHVIQHELGHLHRADLWWRWVFLLVRAVHWFNPLVWLADHAARAEQEFACDEWVLNRTGVDRWSYGESMLAIANRIRPERWLAGPRVSMAESARGLKARLAHLAQIRRCSRWQATVVFVFAVAGVGVLGPLRVAAQSEPQTEFIQQDSVAASGERVIEIESKLAEIPPDVATEVFGELLDGSMSSILSPELFERVIRSLDQRKGVDLLSAPKVSVRSGLRAAVNITREFRYPVAFEVDKASTSKVVPKEFETRNLGIELDVEPVAGPDGSIELPLSARVTDFLGFVNYAPNAPRSSQRGQNALEAEIRQVGSSGAINQPVFEVRQVNTFMEIRSGETVMLGGLRRGDDEAEISRLLFVFVKATEIEALPQPEPVKTPDAPSPLIDSDLPYGTPVQGKPGFVISPYAPTEGYVDLRGFPSNTEVKCPYSGKIFLVP